jgi:hypothetical protein
MGLQGGRQVAKVLRVAGVDDIDVVGGAGRPVGDGAAPDHDEADLLAHQQGKERAKVGPHGVRLPPGPLTRRAQLGHVSHEALELPEPLLDGEFEVLLNAHRPDAVSSCHVVPNSVGLPPWRVAAWRRPATQVEEQ